MLAVRLCRPDAGVQHPDQPVLPTDRIWLWCRTARSYHGDPWRPLSGRGAAVPGPVHRAAEPAPAELAADQLHHDAGSQRAAALSRGLFAELRARDSRPTVSRALQGAAGRPRGDDPGHRCVLSQAGLSVDGHRRGRGEQHRRPEVREPDRPDQPAPVPAGRPEPQRRQTLAVAGRARAQSGQRPYGVVIHPPSAPGVAG